MPKLNHTRVAVIVSLLLALLNVIVVSFTSEWNLRHFYNLFYFTFLSMSALSFNAYIFAHKRSLIPEVVRKRFRILFLGSVITIYVVALLSFAKTGQVTRVQTILFLSGMNYFYVFGLTVLGIILAMLSGVHVIDKQTKVHDLRKKDAHVLKWILWINIVLLLITFFTNAAFFQEESRIISDEYQLITYEAEAEIFEEISRINTEFEKPNVVFILLETLPAERLGLYGYPRNVSPHMDSLAKKSIVFDNAFTTSSHSDYAQPGLLSSRYLFTSPIRTSLDLEGPRKFIWDIFKEDGYTTGYFSSQDDRWQSMDKYYDFSQLDTYSYSMTDGETDYGVGFAQKDYDHKTAELAFDWVSQQDDPYFLYVNFQATHLPRAYPLGYESFKPADAKSSLQSERFNMYDNAVRYVDEQVGKIIDVAGNDTIIILTADHGEDLEGRHDSFNHGLTIYNEELIVPALIYLPGVKPTRVVDRVSHIDFLPTFVDLLGYEIPDEFQGDIMRKNSPIFFVTQSHKYKIGMINGETKVIIDMNRDYIEVYDLESDPDELHPLNEKEYTQDILKLLFWQFCQFDYYEHERWEDDSGNRCLVHNNFKI